MCIQLKSEFSSLFQRNPLNLPGPCPLPEKIGPYPLPQAYRDLMDGISLAWLKQPNLASPEPSRYGLDQVFVPALGGADSNPFWPGIYQAYEDAQAKGLPPYLIPFWIDQEVYFCFDFSQEAKVAIRMVDTDCDQWLVIAQDFSDLLLQWKQAPAPLHLERLDLITLPYLISAIGQEDPSTFNELVWELDFRQGDLCRKILQAYAQVPDSRIRELAKNFLS